MLQMVEEGGLYDALGGMEVVQVADAEKPLTKVPSEPITPFGQTRLRAGSRACLGRWWCRLCPSQK